MEQALGHVAYTRNLQSAYAHCDGISPTWIPIPFVREERLDRVPGVGTNWTARGSRKAWSALRASGGPGRFDAVFFHTQTVALAAPLAARRAPVIVSLDATPANFDSVGEQYGHSARPGSAAERVKRAVYRRVFRSASALTAWSQWAKDSLRDHYDVDPSRVTVVPPGVDLQLFPFGAARPAVESHGPLRILFVGGDFERKGGPLLLQCMNDGLAELCELHIVTGSRLRAAPRVRVYNDLGPNDPRLIDLYRTADIFALPTYADCLAVVLGEAMAAGLPIVTTTVGAQPEAVQEGASGLLVPPGDAETLGRALRRIVADARLREAMGRAGRRIAERSFDARANGERIAAVIAEGADRWRAHH
jgi:glycosyltransferase involved in cell wall biosynthesis